MDQPDNLTLSPVSMASLVTVARSFITCGLNASPVACSAWPRWSQTRPYTEIRCGAPLLGLSGGSGCFARVGFFTPLQKALKQLPGLIVSSRFARR